ncbi:MAG: GerMN domain-containing protein [Thermoleophilia bacterium]
MTRLVALLVVASVLAGCGGANSAIRDEGVAAAGDQAVVSPATATDATTTPAQPVAPAPGVAFVYLLRYNQPEPTRRSVPGDMSVSESSVRELLSGPTLAEATLHYSSAIPKGARLLAYSVADRVAIIDISALPKVQGDNDSEALLALYQIVYTVTASGGIDAVQVRLNGRPYGLNSVTGGSSALEPPLTRADLSFIVAAETLPGSTGCAVAKKGAPPYRESAVVTLLRPQSGESVGATLQIRGTLQSNGGPIVIRLLQDELEVANRIIDEKCRGSFSATIPLPRTLVGSVDVVVIAPGTNGDPAASAHQQVTVTG